MFLADRLSRTLQELRDSLTQSEYVMWSRFHAVKNQQRELAHATSR